MMRRSVIGLAGIRPLASLREERINDVNNLVEMNQAKMFMDALKTIGSADCTANKNDNNLKSFNQSPLVQSGKLKKEDFLGALDAATMTFFLHVESRIASLLGCGFYTIGPCGEELLSPIGLELKTTDPMALHYRHLAVNLGRQVQLAGGGVASDQLLKDIAQGRARGYTVSAQDPVCGGHHCALGGSCPTDYLVTSTLASQTCPAVGRAMGGSLSKHLGLDAPYGKDHLSFVSLGDGSTSNGHFLSGLNLAKFAQHRKFGVPLLMCVTDNGMCISLKNQGYFQEKFVPDMGVKTFKCSATDMVDIWEATAEASKYTRSKREPTALIISNVTRRFGHAATDRQASYLTPKEIQAMAQNNDVLGACHQAVTAGLISAEALSERAQKIWGIIREAFNEAHEEPKITERRQVTQYTSQPLAPLPSTKAWTKGPNPPVPASSEHVRVGTAGTTGKDANLMRKHMNNVLDFFLAEKQPATGKPSDVVYIGEDVTHGGYYLVTEGLQKKHGPLRVADFPPDETSLVGTGMGYSQAGLTPIVELPYAKYLDCGFDMFTEACVMNWLSQGKQPNGLIFRLQGFGRGVFGGNYHTHNQIFIPPGLDVVCYSNGKDYTAGMRYAMEQARAGRLVMSVDCTELLNLRSIPEMIPAAKDLNMTRCAGVSWEFAYNDHTKTGSYLDFDDVTLYKDEVNQSTSGTKLLIVAYGGGMVSALQAGHELRRQVAAGELADLAVDVLDCPLLSAVPKGLEDVIGNYDAVLFADMCKDGQHPFATHISTLMNNGSFKNVSKVRCVAAPRTYNPLGTTLTFLSNQDIVDGALKLLS